jgi:hypothetical protein
VILFRCPSSIEECDETSPFICRPYFRAKNVVAPHVQPYYDQYAAPYVDAAEPYYQTVKVNVFDPAQHYVAHYGAPWVESGKQYAREQWETNGQPKLAHAHSVARAQYDKSVAPHVVHATRVLGPYYNLAYANAEVALNKAVLPAYEAAKPYAIRGYNATSQFAVTTVLPAVNWGWTRTNTFLDTAVWPQLRVVYVENVEPQLVRIGERLGRYKLRSPDKANRESTTTSSYVSKPSPQSTTAASDDTYRTSATESRDSSDEYVEQSHSPVEPPPREENETDRQKRVREMVTQDLESWQEKFAQQAEDGAAAIEDSIDEIARALITNNANTTGTGLVDQLQKTIVAETKSLKSKISSIVADEIEGRHHEDAQEEIVKVIRSAGIVIKGKAQVIRGWREDYDAELQETVLSTADVHFQILEETRSLALQQIGMKWAWTDGVTYKDWAKYHELKSTFSGWTEELKQLIVTHPSLLEAQEASAQVEDDGMAAAAAAAKELASLKEIAKWKMLAEDATDNFDLESLKTAIEEKEKAAREAEEERARAAQEAEEERIRAAQEAEDAAKSTDEDEALDVDSNDLEHADETAGIVQADTFVVDGEEASENAPTSAENGKRQEQDESQDSAITENATAGDDEANDSADITDNTVSTASEPMASQATTDDIVDAPEDATDEMSPEDPETSADAADAATVPRDHIMPNQRRQTRPTEPAHSELEDYPPPIIRNAASESTTGDQEPGQNPDEADQDKSCEPTGNGGKVKGALFGAFAETVPNRQPILDDVDDDEADGNEGDYYARATAAAQAVYARAVAGAEERFSMASSVVSVQMYGTPKPVHKNLLSSLTAAYDNAVSAAGSRFDEATSLASKGLYGSPTPTVARPYDMFSRAEEIAARRLREGKVWAEMQYQSALLAMGQATPTATSTNMPDRVKYNYYAALGIAHDRYARFLSAASSAWSSVAATATPTPTNLAESASSLASGASASIFSAANAAGKAAESAYCAATEGIIAAGEAADEAIYSLFDSAQEQALIAGKTLSEVWETIIEELQSEMYGEVLPIGWEEHMTQESLFEEKQESGEAVRTTSKTVGHREAVVELVSELLSEKEAPFTESVFSRLSAVYASATEHAGRIASAASSAIASRGDKTGENVAEKDEL